MKGKRKRKKKQFFSGTDLLDKYQSVNRTCKSIEYKSKYTLLLRIPSERSYEEWSATPYHNNNKIVFALYYNENCARIQGKSIESNVIHLFFCSCWFVWIRNPCGKPKTLPSKQKSIKKMPKISKNQNKQQFLLVITPIINVRHQCNEHTDWLSYTLGMPSSFFFITHWLLRSKDMLSIKYCKLVKSIRIG